MRESRPERLHALVREHPFGALIVGRPAGGEAARALADALESALP